MVGAATIDKLKQALAQERGREVSDAEVIEVLDYLYALTDLIFESWTEQQVEKKNKLTNEQNDDDNDTGI
jgi:hypothetical protein